MTGTIHAPVQPADADLVEAARRGDLIAWERLVRRYQEPVYRVVWLITRDSDMAQKATLSTFVRAFRAAPSYEAELGVLPWLIRIATGEARQQRREAGRPQPTSRPVEREHGPHVPASAVPGLAQAAGMSALEQGAVSEAFERLGEEDRLVLAARYLLGMDRTHAARALAISEGLVDEHLRDALARLRARMATA